MVGFVVVLAIVIVGVWYLKPSNTEAPVINDDTTTYEEIALSSCGLEVLSPLANTAVSFPLLVNAIVDNTNTEELGCSWVVFEAQAGIVKVMNGATEVGMGILSTTEDWMTSSPVNYSGSVSLSAPVASGTPLTLLFEEENPSGEGIPDTLTIPVISN